MARRAAVSADGRRGPRREHRMTETGVASRAGMAARALLARTYWRLRLYADRSLHWRRHARATNAVKSRPRPRTILVVCHGNICRSPYLAAVLRRALRDVQIVSAGFVGPGRPVPEHSLAIGQRKGLDLAAHRSQLLTPEQLKRADLVLVMDSRQAWRREVRNAARPSASASPDVTRPRLTLRAVQLSLVLSACLGAAHPLCAQDGVPGASFETRAQLDSAARSAEGQGRNAEAFLL